MGSKFCSDNGHRAELDNLRFAATDVIVNQNELSDGDARSIGTCSEQSSAPSIKRVPVSALNRRFYWEEKRKRENFFDLDSVDEANELVPCPEKALSDITSVRYKPIKRSLLTKTNLLMRDHISSPSQRLLYKDKGGTPRSVCSDQVVWSSRRLRSSGLNLDVHKSTKTSGNTGRGSAVGPLGYSTDERSVNTSPEIHQKSDSESDSLKYPKKLAEAKDSLEEVFHKSQFVDRDIINKIKPYSQNTSDTDQTSHRNSGSPAFHSSCNKHHRGGNTFKYPNERKGASKWCTSSLVSNHDFRQSPQVPMLIYESTASNEIEVRSRPTQHISKIVNDKENEVDVALIFKTPVDENVLDEGWSKTDYAPGENEDVALP